MEQMMPGFTDTRPTMDIPCGTTETLQQIADHARAYFAHGKAPSTVRAYRDDWDDFTCWCTAHALSALPATPETIAWYLSAGAHEGRKINTLTRRIAAISQVHQLTGHPSPTTHATVHTVLAGIRRTHGKRPQGVAPFLVEDIRAMVATLPSTLLGVRDRALILLGFAGAFRRSELVALDVADLAWTEDGLIITLRRSKTDQEGEGRLVGIPYGTHDCTCPVHALRAWLDGAGITAGAVFRGMNRHGQQRTARISSRAVADIIKRTAQSAGLDPTRYSGHSLRAGHATTAARAGAHERVIMAQTGHRSERTVRRYIRLGELFRENSANTLGL